MSRTSPHHTRPPPRDRDPRRIPPPTSAPPPAAGAIATPAVVPEQRPAMSHADDRPRAPPRHLVHRRLRRFVQRRRRLVEKRARRATQVQTSKRHPLLFPGGEDVRPLLARVQTPAVGETSHEVAGPHASSAARISSSSKRRRDEDGRRGRVAEDGSASSSDSPAASGKRTCARRLPRGMYGACGRNRRRPGPARQSRPCLRPHAGDGAKERGFAAPAGPTTSAASPSRSSRVRSRHSSRREMGVRTETRSRRSVAPSRGTPRRMKREGMVLVPVASRSRFPRRDFLSLSSPCRVAFALAASSMVSSIAKSRSRRSVSAASPESCSKRPTTMLSAPCTVRNAYPACVTTRTRPRQ